MCVTNIESTVDEGERNVAVVVSIKVQVGTRKQKQIRGSADTQAKQMELKALHWNLGLQLAI